MIVALKVANMIYLRNRRPYGAIYPVVLINVAGIAKNPIIGHWRWPYPTIATGELAARVGYVVNPVR